MFRSGKVISVLKLFKVFKSDRIDNFCLDSLVDYSIRMFEETGSCTSMVFSVNFCKYLPFDFDNLKAKVPDANDIFSLSILCQNTEIELFSFAKTIRSNSKVAIDFYLAFPDKYFENLVLVDFIRNLNGFFSIDYGYIVNLSTRYHLSTERKMPYLGYSFSNTQENIFFTKNLYLIENGYVRNLYNLNILNNAQYQKFKEFSIDCIEIESDLKLVVLDNIEKKRLKKIFCKRKWLIGQKRCSPIVPVGTDIVL